MDDPADGEGRKRKVGSEDPTIHESAGTEGETLGPESAMDSIRGQHDLLDKFLPESRKDQAQAQVRARARR